MKPRAVIVVAVAAVLFAASHAVAGSTSLRGEALEQAIAGSTVYLDTPLTPLPIRYNADGTMTGRSKRLARYTGSVSDSGKWWVRRNKLCQRWRRWLDGKSHCFTLRQKGRKVHWRRDDGETGTATIKSGASASATKPPLPGRFGLTRTTK